MSERHPREPLPLETDPMIEAYKAGVDRTLLRASLLLSVEERIRKTQAYAASAIRLRGLARRPKDDASAVQ